MALWKETAKTSATEMPEATDLARPGIPETKHEAQAPVQPAFRPTPAPTPGKPRAESLIAPDITIEGKIEGEGHVRIAGNFKGDVNVRGDLTIEPGAKVTGSVRAEKVTIAGELIGNIESAAHVELQQSGALTGDLKAGSLSVAAGSRMRGQAEFGWDDTKSSHSANKTLGHDGTAS
ncbi:cell shape determination protein CcmA [Rhodanobacter panaciterrae]|uniref:Cell shape determination protein CcmA n=1 Tax=Rhodanobacter panaciterrae TaxID=490572 RepID=A0ABQ2ZMA9_9GAMM|nr:cell shape determination protein CcmA [Rhodanobacter panaciterrae]